MAHSDIYTKFMIEYDKAQITSSYPSLTKYEIATLLDKAYLSLIAQKLTGNNQRRAPFEGDVKAIEDLRSLIVTKKFGENGAGRASNEYLYIVPEDFLYYVEALLEVNDGNSAIDGRRHDVQTVTLISHEDSTNFKATSTNLPWMSNPVVVFEQDGAHVFIDTYYGKQLPGNMDFKVTYIMKPAKFALPYSGNSSLDENTPYDFGDTKFELSDTMAEELINLAISMALEIVESTRLSTKLNTRILES